MIFTYIENVPNKGYLDRKRDFFYVI